MKDDVTTLFLVAAGHPIHNVALKREGGEFLMKTWTSLCRKMSFRRLTDDNLKEFTTTPSAQPTDLNMQTNKF